MSADDLNLRRPARNFFLRTGRLFLVLILVAAPLVIRPATVQAQAASREYQIKAAFLFNFAQFVEWPAAAFTNADAPICIGILGNDPFGAALEETVKGETIHNRKLIVQRSQRVADLKGCQLIFISKSEKGRMADILAELNGGEVLTVSEIDGFARRGGVINFFLEGNKVRFEINTAAAQREGLKISSQLLSLGKIIGSEDIK